MSIARNNREKRRQRNTASINSRESAVEVTPPRPVMITEIPIHAPYGAVPILIAGRDDGKWTHRNGGAQHLDRSAARHGCSRRVLRKNPKVYFAEAGKRI